METSTINDYKKIIAVCKDIYLKKSKDYGAAWRILRAPSLTDQIFIKAQRIRSTQEKKEMKIDEKIDNEFIGIINYCIMAIIQIESDDENIEYEMIKIKKKYYYVSNENIQKVYKSTKNGDLGDYVGIYKNNSIVKQN